MRGTSSLLLAWLALAPVAAMAASLGVTPTRLELRPGQASGSVTLENQAATAVTLQVQTFAWTAGMAASPELAATRDLITVPPVFALAPGARQIVRVALRAPVSGGRERAYRLMITEVPLGAQGAGVHVTLRLSLPVFATVSGAQAGAAWSVRGDRERPELELLNQGSAHLRVRRIELRGVPGGALVQTIATPVDILAGQAQRWPLTMPMPSRLRLEADTELGPLAAELALPPG